MNRIILGLAVALGLLQSCKKYEIEERKMPRSLTEFQGKQLEVSKRNGNSAAVVFIAGFNSDLAVWDKLYKEMDGNTTLFTYNRPGTGRSQDVAGTRDALEIAAELKAVLEANKVKPPYVLVAHSMGGIYARMFYHQNPTLVKGLVLVDATHERQLDSLLSLIPEDVRRMYREQMDAEHQADLAKLKDGSVKEEFRSNHLLNYSQIKAFGPISNIPVYVTTSTKTAPGDNPIVAEVTAALHQQWAQSAGAKGKFVATNKSGHFIQMEEPLLVLEGIKWAMQ